MATIKSFTDVTQSKVLAEILPIESADMWWSRCTITDFGDGVLKVSYAVEPCNISQFRNTKEDVPCWSLAALLDILYNGIVMNKDSQNGRYHFSSKYVGTYVTADNPIDACYEMILKLHEQNIL